MTVVVVLYDDGWPLAFERVAAEPTMDIDTYVAGTSDVLTAVLGQAGLTPAELAAIRVVNGADG